MKYADTVGLKTVYGQVSDFYRDFGAIWQPAPLLKKLGEQERSFYE